jgi:uncharacterized damage-inducible protein DinB
MRPHGALVPLIDILLPEYDRETDTTRRVLDRVPDGAMGWKPHATSMSLGALAAHVASLPAWTGYVMRDTSLDISTTPPESPGPPASIGDLLQTFDDNVASARALLVDSIDGELCTPWTLRRGSRVVFTLPKIATLRYFVLNHLIHHRGQLCVYLRMLNIEVPAIYGPATDDHSPV